ncbi:MAG: DUF547 domain-containing protein [Cyclobacteriaceae bacterium]
MKKPVHYLLAFFLLTTVHLSVSASLDSFIKKTDAFLKKNVSNGKVDYQAISTAPAQLNELVNEVSTMSVSSFSKGQKLAFYINAYNVLVIKGIASKYPVASPMDISGFFDKTKHMIANESLSLNELENKKVRVYKDARIHFALVCAAISCPELINEAYDPSTVNQQLQKKAIASINNANFSRVKSKSSSVYISEIFKWYSGDFIKEGESIIRYLNTFRKNPIPKDYANKSYPYSWNINKK